MSLSRNQRSQSATKSEGPTKWESTWKRTLIIALLSSLVAASCALPTEDEPRDLSAEDYEEIVFGETTTTVTTPLVVVDPTNVELYFVGADGQLRIVKRPIPDPRIPQILDELEIQPTEAELEQFPDLTSRVIPAFEAKNLGRLDRDEQPSLLTIEVSPLLQETATQAPRQAREAVSQIVCTITNLTFTNNPIPINRVAFIDVDETPLSITDDEGAAIESPFRVSDFNDCQTAEDGFEDEPEDTTTSEP